MFLINDDTEVVSEALESLDDGAPCLKLKIVGGKRVKTPGNCFSQGTSRITNL